MPDLRKKTFLTGNITQELTREKEIKESIIPLSLGFKIS